MLAQEPEPEPEPEPEEEGVPVEDGGMDEVDARLRLVLDADYDAALEDAEFAARLARRKAGLAKQKAKVEISSGVVQVRSTPPPPAICRSFGQSSGRF